jgi:hypothetical protein
VKITECEDIESYSKDKLQYFTVENVINRGYSMLFDDYEIYFRSETRFLIFSRVRSTSENIKKSPLTSEINFIFINKALNFLFITISLLLEHVCFKSERFESISTV